MAGRLRILSELPSTQASQFRLDRSPGAQRRKATERPDDVSGLHQLKHFRVKTYDVRDLELVGWCSVHFGDE